MRPLYRLFALGAAFVLTACASLPEPFVMHYLDRKARPVRYLGACVEEDGRRVYLDRIGTMAFMGVEQTGDCEVRTFVGSDGRRESVLSGECDSLEDDIPSVGGGEKRSKVMDACLNPE